MHAPKSPTKTPNTSPAPCALPPSVPAKSCAESALATWRHATRCGQELGKRHRVEHTWYIYIYCNYIYMKYEHIFENNIQHHIHNWDFQELQEAKLKCLAEPSIPESYYVQVQMNDSSKQQVDKKCEHAHLDPRASMQSWEGFHFSMLVYQMVVKCNLSPPWFKHSQFFNGSFRVGWHVYSQSGQLRVSPSVTLGLRTAAVENWAPTKAFPNRIHEDQEWG